MINKIILILVLVKSTIKYGMKHNPNNNITTINLKKDINKGVLFHSVSRVILIESVKLSLLPLLLLFIKSSHSCWGKLN